MSALAKIAAVLMLSWAQVAAASSTKLADRLVRTTMSQAHFESNMQHIVKTTLDGVRFQFNGVLNMELFLDGDHLIGPNSVDPKHLPQIRSRPVTAPIGEEIKNKAARSQVVHPHKDGTQAVDVYGFVADFVVNNHKRPLDVPIPFLGIPNIFLYGRHIHQPPPPTPSAPAKPPTKTELVDAPCGNA